MTSASAPWSGPYRRRGALPRPVRRPACPGPAGHGAARLPLSALLIGGLAALAGAAELRAQELRTISYSRQVTGEDFIKVEVNYGIGDLSVRSGAPGLLYRARMRFDDRFATPTAEYGEGRLEFGMEMVEDFDSEGPSEMPSMDLELPSGVPMDLQLLFLAGTADVDLTGMPIRTLDLTNGASESEVRVSEVNPEPMSWAKINVGVADFTVTGLGNLNSREVEVMAGLGVVTLGIDGEWPPDSRLSIGMGLGAMRIHIPESLGVRVRHERGFLASLDIDGFEKDGDIYTSENWEDAGRRVVIDLSATLGSVDFVWMS